MREREGGSEGEGGREGEEDWGEGGGERKKAFHNDYVFGD